MLCERCRDLMPEALYGELDAETLELFEGHVGSCAECSALMAGMRETLDVMDRRERRDPGEAYWDGYWDRLQARLPAREDAREDADAGGTRGASWWRRTVVAAPAWSWTTRVAAAAVILLAGVYLGRTFFPARAPLPVAPEVSQGGAPADTTPPQVARGEAPAVGAGEASAGAPGVRPTTPREPTGERPRAQQVGGVPVQAASVNDRAMRYIQKSQLILVALVNTDPDSGDAVAEDLPLQRQRSRALVQEASVLKGQLDRPDQRRLRELVGELQKILVQIANLESDNDMDAVEFIRSRVNEHDVLLKINLEQLRQGTAGDEPRSGTRQSRNPQRSMQL